jgi:hypothetical protein
MAEAQSLSMRPFKFTQGGPQDKETVLVVDTGLVEPVKRQYGHAVEQVVRRGQYLVQRGRLGQSLQRGLWNEGE